MHAIRQVDPMAALARAHAALDELQHLDLTGLSEEALLECWPEVERLRRRIPSVEHQLVLEAEQRGLPASRLARGMTGLLRGLLRLDPAEAAARVRAAQVAGVRRALTGQPLPAVLPELAAAQAEGAVSERHAAIVRTTLERLPEPVRDQRGERIETELVGYARRFDPVGLAKIAERLRYCYDPDGALTDVAHRAKHRELTVQQRPDGSARISGQATAELTELLLLHFDALAAPRPAENGVRDPRTAGQRRHDALLDALKLTVRARQLPSVHGITATLVLTMTAEAFATHRGLARTGHGALLPVPEALRIAAAEYRLMNVVLHKTKGITGYSSTQRLFTEQQRLAILAADGPGCSFPGCPMPIHWCQLDHTTDYAQGGPTRVDAGVLACRYHNVTAKAHGWRSTRINGRAAWVPPRQLDPDQTPRFNDLHHTQPP